MKKTILPEEAAAVTPEEREVKFPLEFTKVRHAQQAELAKDRKMRKIIRENKKIHTKS